MKDEDYLDAKFPKGKTKYRGEAIVLLALSRMVERERILKLISRLWARRYGSILSNQEFDIVSHFKRELKQKIKELK